MTVGGICQFCSAPAMNAHRSYCQDCLDKIMDMRQDGQSARVVAEEMGDGVTRNKIIGIWWRNTPEGGPHHKLAARKTVRNMSSAERAAKGIVFQCKDDPKPKADDAPHDPEKGCKWIYGDVGPGEEWHFCKEPIVFDGHYRRYCAYHARKSIAQKNNKLHGEGEAA